MVIGRLIPIAHVDAGKTTTTEHILYHSGRIRALGSVDNGTAQTDSMDVEREPGISVRSATTSDRFVVEGRLPVATSLEYPVKLSAMSGGRGVITSSFAGYQPSPPDVHTERKRRGVNPLDQSKYILAVRKALST